MQGKLGKAVRICYGHATVMLLEASFKEVKSDRSLNYVIYFCERRSVYEISVPRCIVSFSAASRKGYFYLL